MAAGLSAAGIMGIVIEDERAPVGERFMAIADDVRGRQWLGRERSLDAAQRVVDEYAAGRLARRRELIGQHNAKMREGRMIPKTNVKEWFKEVAERGERETARLEALWAEDGGGGGAGGGDGRAPMAEAFGLLDTPEAAFVRRALITGLNCAARAAGAEGDVDLERRALAVASALEPDAAEIEPLLGWLAHENGIAVHSGRRRGTASPAVHTPNPPARAQDVR